MLSFFLRVSFDAPTIEGLRYVQSDVHRSELGNAKQDFAIVSETQGDNNEVDDDLEYEIQLHSEFCKLVLKDELPISSVVTWEAAIGVIETDLTAKKIPHSCLEQAVGWTSEEM
jgi:hypothetical protein